MFRSTTIIRSLQLSLARVILILKYSVRLRRNLLCGGVAACPSMACVLITIYIKLDGSYMFRSATIIRSLQLSLAEVILI